MTVAGMESYFPRSQKRDRGHPWSLLERESYGTRMQGGRVLLMGVEASQGAVLFHFALGEDGYFGVVGAALGFGDLGADVADLVLDEALALAEDGPGDGGLGGRGGFA